MLSPTKMLRIDTKRFGHKMPHVIFPWFEECLPICLLGVKEILNFSLLQLEGAKDKLSRCHFIAERFTYLADTKRQGYSSWVEHLLEVSENSLRSFSSEVNLRFSSATAPMAVSNSRLNCFGSDTGLPSGLRTWYFLINSPISDRDLRPFCQRVQQVRFL